MSDIRKFPLSSTGSILLNTDVDSLVSRLRKTMRKFLQKKRRKEREKKVPTECKTLLVSVWDAVMKLTAVGKYHFSSDIRIFKNNHFLYCIQYNF